MNQGGEPGRDDYGLPRVDIEIPDDARELYRDVLAYHRELRALRRHERSVRWRAPFRRTGFLIPLVAGCLVLAIVTGLVLSMFSTGPYSPAPASAKRASTPSAGSGTGGQGTGSAAPAASAAAAPSTTPVASLPGRSVYVSGKPVSLSALTSTTLLLVPAGCACSQLVRRVMTQARNAGVPVYLVGSPGLRPTLSKLAAVSPGSSATVAIDRHGVLTSAYRPSGLTALLVDSRGSVTMAPGLRPGFDLAPALKRLRSRG